MCIGCGERARVHILKGTVYHLNCLLQALENEKALTVYIQVCVPSASPCTETAFHLKIMCV